MEAKARLRMIDQILRAGKRKVEHAKEHCVKGGFHTHIDNVLRDIDLVLQELKYHERECK